MVVLERERERERERVRERARERGEREKKDKSRVAMGRVPLKRKFVILRSCDLHHIIHRAQSVSGSEKVLYRKYRPLSRSVREGEEIWPRRK